MDGSKRSAFYIRKIVAPQVARVVASREKDGKTEYLVEWQPSWERPVNVEPAAIKEFENDIKERIASAARHQRFKNAGGFLPEGFDSDNEKMAMKPGELFGSNTRGKDKSKANSSAESTRFREQDTFLEITKKRKNGNTPALQFVMSDEPGIDNSDPEGY